MFKLNKLQKQQSAGNSLSTSPQPHSASMSPNPLLPPRMQPHGHSVSIAHPGGLQQPMVNGFSASHTPERLNSASSDDGVAQTRSPIGIYAPQGRVPAQLFVPSAPSRTESRPDFVRGFGLDIPEEEEEEEEPQEGETEHAMDTTVVESPKLGEDHAHAVEAQQPSNVLDNVVAPKEGSHTRHASRISVALSVGSMSKNVEETAMGHSKQSSMAMPINGLERHTETTTDPLNEWTGTESADELSGDEVSCTNTILCVLC